MLFVEQKVNFDTNEMESKMEKATHAFREKNLVLKL